MQYRAWQLLSLLVQRLPLRLSYAAASAIGTLAFACWPRGRRATIRNFTRVLPGATPAQVRTVARRSLANYCRYLVDFARFPVLDQGNVLASVTGDDSFRALDAVLAKGKGAIIVCMHFGNWDLGAAAATARGYPMTVVAETFRDHRLDRAIVGARKRLGMTVIKMEKVGPSLVRSLRGNGLLALLIDRPVPGDGVKVEFFGQEVEVPAGPARLALRTGAALVPVAFARFRPGRPEVTTLADFGISWEPTGVEDADIRALTRSVMSSHEHYIRAYPEQWYMFREMWPAISR